MEILCFWRGAGPDKWFSVDEAFDHAVRTRFLTTYDAAARDELTGWDKEPEAALAFVIVLDQFPRNLFRGSARAYAADPLARSVADKALGRGFDRFVEQIMRQFFYLPFMHSEAVADQERSVRLYEKLGDPEQLKHAVIHRDVVVQFGRFPHRNRVLGRETTPAEQKFLDEGGFAG